MYHWIWIVWLVVACLLIVMEMNLGTFYMLLAGVAAILAMFAALLQISLIWQGIVFIAATFLFYMYLVPILRKLIPLKKEELHVPTIQNLVGQTGIVVKDITKISGGQVKMGSDIYSAFADEPIPVGQTIQVLAVKVNKLYVKKE